MKKEQKKGMKKLEKDYKELINIVITIIVVVVIVTTFGSLRKIILKINYPKKYTEYVEKYAKENEIEKELIYAMIKAESNFKETAKSNKSAIGLMQIIESTAKEVAEELEIEITKEDLNNPEINIKIGTKYIANLIKKYNNLELAIAAYNAGIGNVNTWIDEGIINRNGTNIENIPFKETNNYVRKILRNYKIYKELYN